MQLGLIYVGVNCSATSEVSNNGGKYGRRRSTLNIGCKPRKGGMLSSKSLSPIDLGDGIRSIVEWMKLPMGSCKAFFLQLQPNFISHLKLVWHLVLIMVFLVLGIGLLKFNNTGIPIEDEHLQ
jgi:hypothetical protein